MSVISSLYVHYVHAANLEQLRDKVDLAVRGLMQCLEGDPNGHIDLQGQPFETNASQAFPEFYHALSDHERQYCHNVWVQAVVYRPGRE